MTWLDFAVFLGVATSIGLAYKRGVILELTDIAIMFVGGLLAFRMYRPIGSSLHSSVLKGFSQGFVEKFVLFAIFITSALVLFGIGLNLQRKLKEDKTIDKRVDEILGAVVGIPKTVILAVSIIGLMFYNEMFPAREIKKLRQGPLVSVVMEFKPVVKPFFYIVAPSDLADDFIKKGLGKSPDVKPAK